MNWCNYIRKLRHDLGLTQVEMAGRLGTSWVTLSRWENGHNRPSGLARLAIIALAHQANPRRLGTCKLKD